MFGTVKSDYVETVDEDSDDLVDMNGDLMDSVSSNRVESAQFTLAEIKAATLKRQYGADNVTDANGVGAAETWLGWAGRSIGRMVRASVSP